MDLVVSASEPPPHATSRPISINWQRIDKDLYLHASRSRLYVYVALTPAEQLRNTDLIVTDIRVSERRPSGDSEPWERRSYGLWLRRGEYTTTVEHIITGVDVLYGEDAVEPRPHWKLLPFPLDLGAQSHASCARLTLCGSMHEPESVSRPVLRTRPDGHFKIVQISDTHMVTGVGECRDSIDAHGNHLPVTEADPRTSRFIADVLEVEKPNLVVFTGDQLHHDIADSQSALFKVVTPCIERAVPFAVVFGNHDSEGSHALSRRSRRSHAPLRRFCSFFHARLLTAS